MLRIFTLILAFCLATAAAASEAWVNAPKDGFLNLRTGPGTGYHVIHKMPHRTKVHILHAPGKWVKVQHVSGAKGWAHSGWLSSHRPAPIRHHTHKPDKHLQTLYVHAPQYGALNMRSGPGKSHPIVMKMKQGSKVEVLGKKGKWLFVRHSSGRIGWAYSAFLVEMPVRSGPRIRHGEHNLNPYVPSGREWRRAFRKCQQYPRGSFHACMARERALMMTRRPHGYAW